MGFVAASSREAARLIAMSHGVPPQDQVHNTAAEWLPSDDESWSGEDSDYDESDDADDDDDDDDDDEEANEDSPISKW